MSPENYRLRWEPTTNIQFGSVAQSCPTLRDPMNRSTPGLPVHYQLLEFTQTHESVMSIESMLPSSHLILCRPLLFLPPIPPSIRVFPNESTLLMRWPKYWSFSFSIIPFKEIPELISFRMDWLDLLAVTNYRKFLKWQEYQTTLSASWEVCLQVQKQHLELDMGKRTSTKWKRSMSRLFIVTLLI